MSECDLSDHPVSLSSSLLLLSLFWNLYECSLGGKLVVLPLFMELWVNLCTFLPVYKNLSPMKPLTRNHSYLVWRVREGPSFYYVLYK